MSVTELAPVADDDFEVGPPRRRGSSCAIGLVLDGGRPPGSTGDPLPEGERRRLTVMLSDDSIEGAQIARLLTGKRFLKVGADAVNRHRRGACRCEQ